MTDDTTTVPVPTLSEVVIKTGRFDLLKDWYSKALCTEPFFTRPRPPETSWTGAQQIAFYKLPGEYPFAQVFGIFEVDGTTVVPGADPGLHHFQLAHGSFDELFRTHPVNAEAFRQTNILVRRVLRLENPLLPAATPLEERALWWPPPGPAATRRQATR